MNSPGEEVSREILHSLQRNVELVRGRIAEATRRVRRPENSVRLVAVTKKCPMEWVRGLISLGQKELGENYPQELWRKADQLGGSAGVCWHLIGHLQSNKAKKTLPLVRMVHAVDSLRLLKILDGLAVDMADPPQVCLQVNLSGEAAKHGWSREAILAEAEEIAGLRSIPVVGLMTMAAFGTTAEEARPTFAALRTLRDELSGRFGRPLPELSMGMSNDFEAAVEEGATMVRVGSALFEGLVAP